MSCVCVGVRESEKEEKEQADKPMRIFQSSNYDGGPLPRGGKLKVVQCASSNVIGGGPF